MVLTPIVMLVALQKCDQETIDELKDIFQSLDINDNGVIDKDDLIENTRRVVECTSECSPSALPPAGEVDATTLGDQHA